MSAVPDADAAARLRTARQRLGLSQEQLARRLGVSFVTVSRWERGRTRPRPELLSRLDAMDGPAAGPAGQTRPVTPAPAAAPLAVSWRAGEVIGREEDLATLAGIFPGVRLLTLVGPAGCGKTRLATEFCRTGKTGPAVLAELEAARDVPRIWRLMANALDLRDGSGCPVHDLVLAELARRPVTVVLDCCEHLRAELARVIPRILEKSPSARVIATSRRPLGLPAECLWPVAPLGLPPPDASPSELQQSAAGRLFLARARAKTPQFACDQANAVDIASLCRRLDGLPLALELAAGWAGTLSPADIARRLDERFDLLSAASSDPGGAREFRATLEWSYALLDDADRVLLRRLSVFGGPFGLADAETVTGPGITGFLHHFRHLVESCWIAASSHDSTITYRMLDTLRAYAAGLLSRAGDAAATRERHTRHFFTLAAASEEGLAGPQQAEWLARIGRADSDLGAILSWSLDGGDPDSGLALAAALWRWWFTSGRLLEGITYLEQLLQRSRSAPEHLRGRALCAVALLEAEHGRYQAATRHASAARRALLAAGDRAGAALACTVLGSTAKYQGDFPAAQSWLRQAVGHRHAVGDDRGLAIALNNLATAAIDGGQLRAGKRLIQESLRIKRRLPDRRSLAYGLVNLADVLVREGCGEQAAEPLQEAGEIGRELGDSRLQAFAEHNLGDVAAAAGRAGEAIPHFEAALGLFRQAADTRDVALALCSLGRATLAAGDLTAAAGLLRESEALAIELGDRKRLAEVQAALRHADLAAQQGVTTAGLTPRQTEVLALVATGLSNREIAGRLRLSAATVERHVADIYARLGVRGRVEVTRFALAHGLTDD